MRRKWGARHRRLAELIAALSQVTDLGMVQPPEDAIRSCLLAISLARRMDLSKRDVGDIYYATLLQHIGFAAYAYVTGALFGGNDIAVRADGARIDVTLQEQRITHGRTRGFGICDQGIYVKGT